jgi:ParB family transcriptional regulator, chromosome partitioning protein
VARRGGLGKGLGALIPPGAAKPGGAATEIGLQDIPVAAIRPNRFQPRERFNEESLGRLADSIREVGLLQPVLVRSDDEGGFELIAGERRWRAARRAGLQSMPALVRATDDAGTLEQALVENLQREGLNALEEAAAYQQLLEDFDLTHEQVAGRVGRSRATVTNTLRLLALPPAVQRLLRDGQLGMGHARALLGSPDRGFQERLARQAAEEGLSVRAVEDAIRRHGHEPGDGDARGGENDTDVVTRTRLRPPGILELEELLGDHLETRVRITMGARRGRVNIEFSTLEDLERIYRLMTEASETRAFE